MKHPFLPTFQMDSVFRQRFVSSFVNITCNTSRKLICRRIFKTSSDLRKNDSEITQTFKHVQSRDFLEHLYSGVINKDRGSLSRAITLVESLHPKKIQQAQELLSRILAHNKKTNHQNHGFRIGMLYTIV